MKLKTRTLRDLAEMVTGGAASGWSGSASKWDKFPYRSSGRLTDFFIDCDLEYRHDGGSRVPWTQGVLTELNDGPASKPQLPSDGIVRVVEELMDPANFTDPAVRAECLEQLNEVLAREGLQAYFDGSGRCHVRAGQTTSAGLNIQQRVWSQKDIERQKAWEAYLATASEDDFTVKLLLPLLQQCGFRRIKVAGHTDKALEFGKDIWMKLQLPTSHFIYFGVQVKKGKIDAAGKTKSEHENITEVLNQARMAMAHPIWDTEVNKRVLIDHLYIVASGVITKQAKQLLGEKLDIEGRRQIIFMDAEDVITLAVQLNMPLPADAAEEDDVPF
jgi:hypothetical protein